MRELTIEIEEQLRLEKLITICTKDIELMNS